MLNSTHHSGNLVRFRVALILPAALVWGCHSTAPSQTARDYQTTAAEPHRDTDLARRDNETALELMAKEDYAGAEPLLRNALSEDVMFGPAHNNLGLVYFHQSRLYLAAWEFQYAAKLMPNQPEARNNLGLVFEAGGKLDQAIETYDQALKLEPDNAQFIGNDARARVRRGDRDKELRGLLERVVAVDTRPDWVQWARQQLALSPPPATAPAAQ